MKVHAQLTLIFGLATFRVVRRNLKPKLPLWHTVDLSLRFSDPDNLTLDSSRL